MEAEDPEKAAEQVLPPTTRETLRKQATSVTHLLTHKPKNPYCAACKRAKLKHIRKYRGSYQRQAQSPGQNLTADTVTSKDDAWQAVLMTDPVGIGTQGQRPKHAFMIKDEHTGLKHMFPLHEKNTNTHTNRRYHFYSDKSGAHKYTPTTHQKY